MDAKITTRVTVPLGQKIAFGLGMLANQMFPAALGIFMVVLVQDLGFPGWMWGILFFLPRVFDSLTDPIMGFISDNTRSIWGRRRQYVFIGAIIMGISFIVMWQLYRDNPLNYNFTYFLLWSFSFYLGLTIFSVPYVAMGYEMSEDFHERTDIMAVAQWIGQWAWVIAPWLWVIMYDQDWFPNADTATRTLAVWVGIGCMLLAMVPAIFLKSRSTKNDTHLAPLNLKSIGNSFVLILKSFKEAFQSVPFRKLCIATFLIFNAFNTIASFSFFIVVYHLFGGNAGDAGVWPTLFGSLGALVTTFVVIPIVARISKVLGKKRAFLLSQSISIIGYVLLWFLFIPGKPYMFIFALPFFSFGIGSLFTLMMSMTADVCDLDELHSGKRREGIFGAIYWWMVKFGFAIAGLLSGAILSLVGFSPGAEVQPEGAVTGLRMFYSGIPIFGTLLAMYVMRNYDLSEEKSNEIRAELNRRKAEKISGYLGTKIYRDIDPNTTTSEELVRKYPYYIPPPYNINTLTETELKEYFRKSFGRGMHGICFTAYEKGQNPGDQINEQQIKRRLEIIKSHTKWIRTFSCTHGHEKIARLAKEMGFKVMAGAWISSNLEENEKEIESLIKLIKNGQVDFATVGNEVLYRKELSEERIIEYLERIKSVSGNLPVGYVDVYYEFINRPALVSASDAILVNCYPYWEGTDIRLANLYLQEMYQKVLDVANGKKVIVTETGWPSEGQVVHQAIPSKENVMRYFVEIQEWQKRANIEVFYFSSFDESWKLHFEGWTGTSWGLWDEEKQFKFDEVFKKTK